MGRFVNPDNSAFQDVLNSKVYVDKTGLLDYINSVIDTTDKFICNSRPRRFEKTITADMIETISNPQQSWGDSWTQGAINVVSN